MLIFLNLKSKAIHIFFSSSIQPEHTVVEPEQNVQAYVEKNPLNLKILVGHGKNSKI